MVTTNPFSYLAYDEDLSDVVLKRDPGSDGNTEWELVAHPYADYGYGDNFAIKHVATNKCLAAALGSTDPVMPLRLQDCMSPQKNRGNLL